MTGRTKSSSLVSVHGSCWRPLNLLVKKHEPEDSGASQVKKACRFPPRLSRSVQCPPGLETPYSTFSKIINIHAFNLAFHFVILAPFESLKTTALLSRNGAWLRVYEPTTGRIFGFDFRARARHTALPDTPIFLSGAIASVNLTLGRSWQTISWAAQVSNKKGTWPGVDTFDGLWVPGY
ncbi:uncharacterized protein PG998_000325 [Apiospora kogelbergensis]|uniref:Uncharacterized protein n=1 Tax=Apiospora kogelbergensis TaxID=1337665 RepID=A0AAW0QXL4_9PEZI